MKIKDFAIVFGVVALVIGVAILAGLAFEYGKDKYKDKDKEEDLRGSMPTIQNMIGTEDNYFSLDGTNNTTTKSVSFGAEMDQINLNLSVNASGTEAIIIEPYFSNEIGCGSTTDSTIVWFAKSQLSISSAVVTINASSTYGFTSPAAGIHSMEIPFTDTNARCLKVIAYTDDSTGAARIWLEAQAKETGN